MSSAKKARTIDIGTRIIADSSSEEILPDAPVELLDEKQPELEATHVNPVREVLFVDGINALD